MVVKRVVSSDDSMAGPWAASWVSLMVYPEAERWAVRLAVMSVYCLVLQWAEMKAQLWAAT